MLNRLSSATRPVYRLLPAACAVMLGGCMVGPDYHRPDQPMPDHWTLSTTRPAAQPGAALATWWSSFGDLTLDALVNRSLAGNLDLQMAESRIVQARAVRRGVASGLWPTVDTQGSADRSRSPAPAAGEHALFQAGLDAAWELDIFGGTRRSVEAADAQVRSAIEDRRDVEVTLIAEVALNYIDLRSAQRQIAISTQNLEAQQRSAQVTQKRFTGGFVSKLDVANAQAEAATTQANIPLLRSSARQSIYNIALLLGRPPGEIEAELSPPAPDLQNLPEIPAGVPSDLLLRRPDIRRAESDLHAATAGVGVATADLFPKFSLTGSFGFQSDALKSLLNWNQRTWSVGPAVSWPLFDAGRIRANIDVQNALQQQALLNYRKTVLTALRDVQAALATCNAEHERRQALLQALAANREAADLATRLYTQGETDFLNVLSAQRAVYASETALALSDQTLAGGLVSLYKALGGGWNPADLLPQPMVPAPTTQPAP